MRDTIYTIPINDVFREKGGCPICRMEKMLEERLVEYIMGASMMEPDIRIETNRYGFCPEHLNILSAQKNRLSLALMLETHLDELTDKFMPPRMKKGDFSPADSCFICKEIEGALDKLLGTTVRMYIASGEFKDLFLNQEYYCFKHYGALCRKGYDSLNKKQYNEFSESLTELTKAYIKRLRENVHQFSLMFDYRNSGNINQSDEVKKAIESAIQYLSLR